MPDLLVDAAALAVTFGEALRRAGLPVTPERSGRFAAGLALVPPTRADRLYWVARVAFVSAPEQLAAFDRVFAAVFGGGQDLATARGQRSSPPPDLARPGAEPAPGRTAPALRDDADDDAGERRMLAAASPDERLRTTSFADLEPEELADLRRLIRRLALAPPPRRARRTRSCPTGDRLDLRRTLRRAQRTAGDPVRLARRRRRLRPRRLVLLCDVSASMEPYTRAFLTLLQGAVAGAHAEAFVFATRLTRLTRPLAGRDPDAALARAAASAPDWAGGTRVGESLRAFVDGYGRRGLARGAVVVILSDGWERDDPELVGEQMARLRRLAFRIVWVNPRRAGRAYVPLVGGMAAALPHVDAFVSGHTLAALDEVVAAVAGP